MYIEASYPRSQGEIARLSSGRLRIKTSYRWCLTFWYHMYGNSMGSLRVKQKYIPKSGRPYMRTVAYFSGNRGDNWLFKQVQLNSVDDFQVKMFSHSILFFQRCCNA